MIKKIEKVIAGVLLLPMILFNILYFSPETESYADNSQKELQDNINKAVETLEGYFDEDYNNALEEIKSLIKEKGWDYEMTLMSFYDNGNPFRGMDYARLIAALSTVREMSSHNASIFSSHMLTDVDYLSYEVKEEVLEDGKTMGNITLSVKDPEYVFEFFGIDMDDTYKEQSIQNIYENKVKLIDAAVYGVDLKQNTFIQTRYDSESDGLADFILKIILSSNLSNERKALIRTAMSLIGQVPYQWGGKATQAGYDNSWWLYLEDGDQKGLDCSGYVQWAFMTAGFESSITEKLLSTSSTIANFNSISEDELLPGDLGLFNNGSLSTNHVGIYLGDGYWIHCSSSKGTVAVTENVGFNLFVRVIDTEEGEEFIGSTSEFTITDEDGNTTTYNPEDETEDIDLQSLEPTFTIGNNTTANESDVYLLAQLIHHEAGNQGFNGLVAVAETVMNRLKSNLFPDTIEEVIYQEGQFSGNSELKEIIPSDEEINIARDVMEGKLSILNNDNVLYFKNPTITDGIAASVPKDWGTYKWYMAVGAHAFYLQS